MNAKDAINTLKPEKWAKTPPAERLRLLELVRENLKTYGDELATSDSKMKNELIGEQSYTNPISKVGTVVPMANTVSAAIELYEGLVHGEMPEPLNMRQIGEDEWEIKVFPKHARDRVLYSDRGEFLRVKGQPKQISPLDKPAGITAVLGAGNYSSALEMLKAIFFDNKATVHKPHHINAETDKVWAKIMVPLVEYGALSFVGDDQGRELTTDPRIDKIYFTGGDKTAQAIMKATKAEFISECGGNNPVIIVPGDRPWTDKEMTHQAQQLATINKMNGGAVCGRVQTIVTCKNWSQRDQFLNALRKAIKDDTPPVGTYYPGSDNVKQGFLEAYPDAEVIKPEGGKHKNSDMILITGAKEDSYATQNEAFCQIIGEVSLDVSAKASEFLPAAVEFCNTKLIGTLGSAILIDEDTKKAHDEVLEKAVTDMEYGAVAVNAMPPFIFLSPWLTWGGNEEGKEFISGRGNFGNGMNFENVEKSVMMAGFMSPGHMIQSNKAAFDKMTVGMARYAVEPTWKNLTKMMGGVIVGSLRKKDF